jgi:hypothetical protein
VVPRPLEEVLDEVEQSGVRPVEILEQKDHRSRARHQLEQASPRREQILLIGRSALGQSEKVAKTRLDPGSLLRVGDEPLDGTAQLRLGRRRGLIFEDARSPANHLCERPVRHALPVGEAPAAVPPDVVDEAVYVLLELPCESRLAYAGHADDRDETRLPLVDRRVEQLLDEPELSGATDEGSLEAG